MATPFQDVYDVFLGKITDFDLANLTDDELKERLFPKMKSAISKFRQCKQELILDEMFEEFSLKLEQIEVEIIASLMVVEWYTPQINNVLNTKQFLSDKDYRFYSQANHLKSNMEAKKEALREANRLISDYSFQDNEM